MTSLLGKMPNSEVIHALLFLLGFIQFLQYYYQSGCLYRLRALGERHNMDLTVGEYTSLLFIFINDFEITQAEEEGGTEQDKAWYIYLADLGIWLQGVTGGTFGNLLINLLNDKGMSEAMKTVEITF